MRYTQQFLVIPSIIVYSKALLDLFEGEGHKVFEITSIIESRITL